MKYRVLSSFDYETKDGDGNTEESFRWNTGDTLDTSKIPGSGNPPLDLEFLLGVKAVEPIKPIRRSETGGIGG